MGSRSTNPFRRTLKPNIPKNVKIVVVGDETVGKTSLIACYQQQACPFDDHFPNVTDVFEDQIPFEGKQIKFEIHDTSGDPRFGANRRVCYKKTDCFMICVAFNNETSLENVLKWHTEIRQVCPDTPIILVATKSDLREKPGMIVDCMGNYLISDLDLKQKS